MLGAVARTNKSVDPAEAAFCFQHYAADLVLQLARRAEGTAGGSGDGEAATQRSSRRRRRGKGGRKAKKGNGAPSDNAGYVSGP